MNDEQNDELNDLRAEAIDRLGELRKQIPNFIDMILRTIVPDREDHDSGYLVESGEPYPEEILESYVQSAVEKGIEGPSLDNPASIREYLLSTKLALDLLPVFSTYQQQRDDQGWNKEATHADVAGNHIIVATLAGWIGAHAGVDPRILAAVIDFLSFSTKEIVREQKVNVRTIRRLASVMAIVSTWNQDAFLGAAKNPPSGGGELDSLLELLPEEFVAEKMSKLSSTSVIEVFKGLINSGVSAILVCENLLRQEAAAQN